MDHSNSGERPEKAPRREDSGGNGWDTNRTSWTQRRHSVDKSEEDKATTTKATRKTATGCWEGPGEAEISLHLRRPGQATSTFLSANACFIGERRSQAGLGWAGRGDRVGGSLTGMASLLLPLGHGGPACLFQNSPFSYRMKERSKEGNEVKPETSWKDPWAEVLMGSLGLQRVENILKGWDGRREASLRLLGEST